MFNIAYVKNPFSYSVKRIEQVIEFLTKDKSGFREGKGTKEAFLALRQIIEKHNRKTNTSTTFTAFVDLEKAFDNVK